MRLERYFSPRTLSWARSDYRALSTDWESQNNAIYYSGWR